MSHSQNSMGYMVALCIILYIVGVSIYLFVKFVRKKLDEARPLRSNSKDVEMELKVMYTKQYARF